MRQRLLAGFFIGDYYIEPLTGTVRGPGGAGHLHPKAVEILLCLASNPRSVISRDELIAAAWGDAECTPTALNSAMSELRHALDDHRENPRYVQTMPKRGYRLLVEPRFAADKPPALPQPAPVGFVGELNRRGVIETAVAYFVVGWLLIQIADVTFDQLALPEWAATFVTVFVISGFPLALLLAWFLELTERGAVIDRGTADERPRKTFGTKYVAVVGGLLVASAGVYTYERFVGLPRNATTAGPLVDTAASVEPNSIAVLRLLNIDGSEQTRIFSDGLVEDVTSRLATVPGMHVSARGDAFSLAPNSKSQDVRNRLRVAYYLEGSARITEQTLRVVIQLIDSTTGFHVVARNFERELVSFAELQREITDLIVANLRVALPSATDSLALPNTETASFDAYLHYRRGMEILYQPMTPATIDEALAAFDVSLAIDADYAAAHAGICLTYTSGYTVTHDAAYIARAEESCAAALSLNANLVVVHTALGDLNQSRGRYAEAEEAFQQALEINANHVPALTGLADVHRSQQRLDDAEREYRRAIGLQPGNWRTYNSLGRFLYANARYAEAASQYREVVAIDASNAVGWSNLAAALTQAGDFAAAAAAFERAAEIDPRPVTYMNLGMLHYYQGEAEAATAALERAVATAPNNYLAWSNLGDVRAFSGDQAAAREAFSRARQLALEQLEVNSRDAATNIDLAWIEAMLGDLAEAERLITRALDIAPSDPQAHFIDALVRVRMRDLEGALDRLETAAALGYSLTLIRAEPHLAALRDQERFARLVRD